MDRIRLWIEAKRIRLATWLDPIAMAPDGGMLLQIQRETNLAQRHRIDVLQAENFRLHVEICEFYEKERLERENR
jgi:hypothetical protein